MNLIPSFLNSFDRRAKKRWGRVCNVSLYRSFDDIVRLELRYLRADQAGSF